ncbi:MAG: aldo/keto reductase [Planctomycetales bacterium]|nr:aldo/keto reductase [Planctomycetales bacterium]
MLNRRLGNTDLIVSPLGYGSMGLRGPRTWGVRVVEEYDAERMLNAVIDQGINFIDTSPDYGICEHRIGKYLSSRRSEYFLATKCGCVPVQHADYLEISHRWEPSVVRANLENSLRRLQTDYLDILQFHGGDARTLQENGLIDLLNAFRLEGKIRYLGVSSSLPNLPDLLGTGSFDTIQVPFSCLAPEHADLIREAEARSVGVIVRGGIAHGGPDAEIQRDKLNAIWQRANLDELVPAGMSRAEFILRHTLAIAANHTIIVGTSNLTHLRDNVAAARLGPLPIDLCEQVDKRVAEIIQAR